MFTVKSGRPGTVVSTAGQGLGALIMSHLADRFGRKTVHVLAHIGVMVSMVIMAFSTNIIMLLTLRLITGTFQQGIVCTGKILALELFPREVRSHTEAASFIAWSVGIMILALFGYVFRGVDWRYLQIGLSAFSFYALFEWWMLEESVRWLLTNGKVKQAKKILKNATKWNKVEYKKIEDLPHFMKNQNQLKLRLTRLESSYDTLPDGGEKGKRDKTVVKYNVIDILKNPKLRVNTLILWFSWQVFPGNYINEYSLFK
ncbi:organic cation transporter protein-like isoform X1 [Mercenaria mercenaria]|uniref:organic cation transporter protein-like isoform X1 n=1 Tax=Mercenaria mercenaria TaxID=6596 RepID=UPI00234E5963|nr:organic cation transporter protein-like isoform X1 [Mercenaria mercenaria]